MTAPVYQPASRVDRINLESFRQAVTASATRYAEVVIDCSQVSYLDPIAMRLLSFMACSADVVLVNPNQMVRLFATVYGVRVVRSGEQEASAREL